MRFIYSLAFYLMLPAILLRLLWRAWAAPAYARRWSERFGFGPTVTKMAGRKLVWLHTVSVGEFIAALPLIHQLLARGDLQLLVTTTTPTGSERVRASLGDKVFHCYAPYDLPDVLARFFNRVKPDVVLIMETELWPNTIAACATRDIPVVLINARMSERSARGYKRFAAITEPMLRQLTKTLVQNRTDAQRLQSLGLPAANTLVTGSIKFDLSLSDELRAQSQALKADWSQQGRRVVWIAASTHQGEDEIILDAFKTVRQNPALASLLLVLVPRHPERFNAVASLCEGRGFSVVRRSRTKDGSLPSGADIVVGDTMGELMLMFGASDIAFVGGSLVPSGGHNFIEPAAWALPLLSGPHVFNFAEVARLLDEVGGLQTVSDAAGLAHEVILLATNPSLYATRAAATLGVATDNRGALARTLTALEPYLSKSNLQVGE